MLELVEVVDGGAQPLDVPLGQVAQEQEGDCGVDSHVDTFTVPVLVGRQHLLLVQIGLERVAPVLDRVRLQARGLVACKNKFFEKMG